MENRHGLAVAGIVTQASGTAERRASEIMLKAKSKAAGRRITAGEDKAYDTADRPTHHAAPGLWHVAISSGDDRVHLRLGQTARDHAQDQTSRHRSRRRQLPAQFDRL